MSNPTRAEMVAAIRALADFVETRTDVPVPNSVRAQASMITYSPDHELTVRAAADALGVPASIDDRSAYATFEVFPYPATAGYAVHGFLRDPDPKHATTVVQGERDTVLPNNPIGWEWSCTCGEKQLYDLSGPRWGYPLPEKDARKFAAEHERGAR